MVLDEDTPKQLKADKLWQPTLAKILELYSSFIGDASKCNVVPIYEAQPFHRILRILPETELCREIP